jgi:NADPH2:quinone reductase
MRAIQVHETTGPDGLRLVELPEPAADGGVLIDVRAAGISFPDLLLSRGEYQLKPDPPFTPGVEVAGVVRSAPEGSGFAPGDRVMAFTAFGGFAEVAVGQPGMTWRLPEQLSFAEGAALPMNYHTAHFALVRRAALRPDETLLVQGAAGGVGTAAIQIGKAVGARVVAVVSTDEKAEVARRAGADEVVRTEEEWPLAHVVFDPVGGERLSQSIRRLHPEGRLVVIGFTEGEIPSVKVNRLLFRNVGVIGAAWGEFALRRPEYIAEVAADLERMIAAGQVKPLVGATYALEEVPQALRDLAERRATGKLVLDFEKEAQRS